MKNLLLFILLCFQVSVNAQTVIEAQNITSDAGIFNSNAPVTNLGLDVNAQTTSATEFPFAPGSGIATGIGYISSLGVNSGTITHTFANATSVSQVLLWNAYFSFELNHSSNEVLLTFRNEMGSVIATENVTFLQATSDNLLPEVIDLSTEITGVKEIDFQIINLHGGNDISLRRLAYAGNGLINVSTNDPIKADYTTIVSPNPATNSVNIPLANISKVSMIDITGRLVNTNLTSFTDHAQLSWNAIEPGVYYLNIFADEGHYSSRIVVLSH